VRIVLNLTVPQTRALVYAVIVAGRDSIGTPRSRTLAKLALKVSDAVMAAEAKK